MRRLSAKLASVLRELYECECVSVARVVLHEGRPVKGLYDPSGPFVRVSITAHDSLEDMIRTVIHEALHHAGLSEVWVDEALDEVAMQSRSCYGLASMILLDAFFRYHKRRAREDHKRKARVGQASPRAQT